MLLKLLLITPDSLLISGPIRTRLQQALESCYRRLLSSSLLSVRGQRSSPYMHAADYEYEFHISMLHFHTHMESALHFFQTFPITSSYF